MLWCPGAESNHRHEDFQSDAIQANAGTYEATLRQTPDETSITCTTIVKPGLADLTKENAATSAKVNGAKDIVETVYSGREYIAAFPILATHWGALV
ncbi:hypothetical protein [Pseudooctadecabacter sp.]|uniref:hypothetical protein n=1 Tax=Pseudooctadecabacter sp. TaxID=1966338 RepID=UPI0025DD8BD4|nr:hypothetical protein [Pseudooctadecabacter sp.]